MGIVAYLRPIAAAELASLHDDPDAVLDGIRPDDAECLDKAWHAIHGLLTGSASVADAPLGLAVIGAPESGPPLNHGAARLATREQVGAIAAALEGIGEDEFRNRFDPPAMDDDGVYRGPWVHECDAGRIGYVMSNLGILAGVHADAAQRGDAVLQWLD